MVFADAVLARRLEASEAANARECTALYPEAAALEVAGGWAVFAGSDSPLSNAVGIGLNGRVSEAELTDLERFFEGRGARVAIDLCPLADPGLVEMLGRRGYRATEFNNVLVRRMAGWERMETPRVRRTSPEYAELWAYTVGRGFFERTTLSQEEMDVGRAIFAMPGAMCYLAGAEGGAAAAVYGGLAMLFADSTIAGFRRQGLHRELIAARLNEAMLLGCDLATASTQPATGSQRNYEQMGFEVAYTKVTMVRDQPAHC